MLTARGWVCALLAAVLIGSGWLTSLPELFAIGCGFGAVVAFALVWIWFPTGRPTISATAQPAVHYAGTRATIVLALGGSRLRTVLVTAAVSDGRSIRLWAVRERTPRDPRSNHSGKPWSTGAFDVALPVRGRLTVGPFVLHRTDPFGICRLRHRSGPALTLRVRPRVWPADPIHSLSNRSQQDLADQSSATTRHRKGSESERTGLRAYAIGDELRMVHWPASQRGRGLLVRTADPELPRSLVICFDDRASSHTAASFELGASALASLLVVQTHASGALAPSIRFSSDPPDTPALDAEAALDRFVDAQPANDVPGTDSGEESGAASPPDLIITGPLCPVSEASSSTSLLFVCDPEPSDRPRVRISGAIRIVQPGDLEGWLQR